MSEVSAERARCICGRRLPPSPVYCAGCGLILCNQCWEQCSTECRQKSYARIRSESIVEDDTFIRITVAKQKRVEFNVEALSQQSVTIEEQTPMRVVISKTYSDFELTIPPRYWQPIVNEHTGQWRHSTDQTLVTLKPFKVIQTWMKSGHQYCLPHDQSIRAETVGSRELAWHPHVNTIDKHICLGQGSSLIKKEVVDQELESSSLENFLVIESVLRDFGELEGGYVALTIAWDTHWFIEKELVPESVTEAVSRRECTVEQEISGEETEPRRPRIRIPVDNALMQNEEPPGINEVETPRVHSNRVSIRRSARRLIEALEPVDTSIQRTHPLAPRPNLVVPSEQGSEPTGRTAIVPGARHLRRVMRLSWIVRDRVLYSQEEKRQIVMTTNLTNNLSNVEAVWLPPGWRTSETVGQLIISRQELVSSNNSILTQISRPPDRSISQVITLLSDNSKVIGWLDPNTKVLYCRFDFRLLREDQKWDTLFFCALWIKWLQSLTPEQLTNVRAMVGDPTVSSVELNRFG